MNKFSVFGEHIKNLSSKQSKLNFWNRLHHKIAFLWRFWTQTVTSWQRVTILTSSVKEILKAMTNTDFLGPSLGLVQFLFKAEGLSNKRADWLDNLLLHNVFVLSVVSILWELFHQYNFYKIWTPNLFASVKFFFSKYVFVFNFSRFNILYFY